MLEGYTLGYLHQAVGYLLTPVLILLGAGLLLVIWEAGISLSERVTGSEQLQKMGYNQLSAYTIKRIDRVDLLSRCGPILGLMGTLIPLGPGLTAMSQGDLSQLATAISIAFDTTVIGLVIGLAAFVLGRHRRRYYENVINGLLAPANDSALNPML